MFQEQKEFFRQRTAQMKIELEMSQFNKRLDKIHSINFKIKQKTNNYMVLCKQQLRSCNKQTKGENRIFN